MTHREPPPTPGLPAHPARREGGRNIAAIPAQETEPLRVGVYRDCLTLTQNRTI
jgi:hypothetical protein